MSHQTEPTDVIGMVMFVSSIGFVDGYYKRKIPVRNVMIIDGSFKSMMIVVNDKLLTTYLTKWARCSDERTIIVVTMLRAKREQDFSLHSICFSRAYFEPNIAIARELRRSLNNELSEKPSP